MKMTNAHLKELQARSRAGVKRALAALGIEIIRTRRRYGIAPWEDIARLAAQFARPIRCIFDVGANNGAVTKVLLRTFPGSRVYAFEPHPETFAQLRRLTPSARLLPQPYALGNTDGTATFYTYGDNKLNSLVSEARYTQRQKSERSEVTVSCATIDSFCKQHGIDGIDLLKIYTEGHDLFVLHGAEQMLRSGYVGFVYVEFNDCATAPNASGGSLVAICNYLAQFGFHFVATYTELVAADNDFFVVANLLMAHSL